MRELSTFGLVALTIAALGYLVARVARRRGRGPLAFVLLASSVAWLCFVVLAVLGAVLPDRLDQLDPARRAQASDALEHAAGCRSTWPLVVVDVSLSRDGSR